MVETVFFFGAVGRAVAGGTDATAMGGGWWGSSGSPGDGVGASAVGGEYFPLITIISVTFGVVLGAAAVSAVVAPRR